MKVEINVKFDLFEVITVTVSNRKMYFSAECASDKDAFIYIQDKLKYIASDTVRKMYEQKLFFFQNGKYNSSQLNAFNALRECQEKNLTIEMIGTYVLPILSDLIPSKQSQHYELFKSRYDWLCSLCLNVDFNTNARLLREKYIINKTEQNALTA